MQYMHTFDNCNALYQELSDTNSYCKMSQLVLYLLLFGIAAPTAVLANPGYKSCIAVQPSSIPVNESWYQEVGLAGLYIVKHSDCNNCEKQEDWTWMKGRSAVSPVKYCWAMEGITQYTYTGVFVLDFICEHTGKVEQQNCISDFGRQSFGGVNFAGNFTITMTDNKNYFAGAICLFGRENFWWMAFTRPNPNSRLVEKIEKHFADSGFTASVANEDDGSKVVIKKLTIVPC